MARQYTDRVRKLADHFKVARGTRTLPEWVGEIKKAAKQPNMSLEELYADTFEKASKPAVEKVVQAKAEVIEKSGTSEPAASQTMVPHTLQRIEVAAPVIQVQPQPVVIQGAAVRDLRLVDVAHRLASNVFIFGSGVMFGVLVSNSLLKALAVSVAGLGAR